MWRWSGRGCTVRPSAQASTQERPWAIKSGKVPSRELRIRAILLRLTLSLVAVIGAVLANYHTLGLEYTHGGIRCIGMSAKVTPGFFDNGDNGVLPVHNPTKNGVAGLIFGGVERPVVIEINKKLRRRTVGVAGACHG